MKNMKELSANLEERGPGHSTLMNRIRLLRGTEKRRLITEEREACHPTLVIWMCLLRSTEKRRLITAQYGLGGYHQRDIEKFELDRVWQSLCFRYIF